VFRVTRRYRFSASHRLHSFQLSNEENQRVYGKCNHPYGHGHDYTVEVSVRGPIQEATGQAVDTAALDRMVGREVLAPFEHRNLNEDVNSFREVVPTSENLALEICRRLKKNWGSAFAGEWPRLEKVRIVETPRNIFEVRADEIE
jgi:6-pyruvoyltetrahydropterin/6-carboxytetrahydropterin synthase